jgi:hypothetical protein
MGGTRGTHGRDIVFEVLMGKPEGKRPLGKHRCNGRMGAEWSLGRLAGVCKSRFSWLRIGTGGGRL